VSATRTRPAPIAISVTVNGEVCEALVQANRSLLDFVREDLALTGTKSGCNQGDCGACTVLLDGRAVPSCLTLAVEADGRRVTTIEGLATDTGLHPVQQAFLDHAAVQCGFCTPGMVLSSVALLAENPHPTAPEVRHAIAGNLCRCTGYTQIVEAVLAAASGES
jgi:carbon-monoxide dehydrogenase small subunit